MYDHFAVSAYFEGGTDEEASRIEIFDRDRVATNKVKLHSSLPSIIYDSNCFRPPKTKQERHNPKTYFMLVTIHFF